MFSLGEFITANGLSKTGIKIPWYLDNLHR